jgi:ferredoxin
MSEKVSFDYIKSLFDDTWDVGVISAEQLKEAAYNPIKQPTRPMNPANFTNHVHYRGFTNTVILIKKGETWDYSHYDEALEILNRSGLKNWFEVFTNYKVAAILAGLGVRARNSLVYSYKFGFDCHISAIGFNSEIIDLPTNRRVNRKMWKRCQGCDDCYNACPPKAIHNKEEPYWLDSMACDNFIGYSDHPTIPSIKKFWHENVYPELPKEEVAKIKNWFDVVAIFDGKVHPGSLPWNKNGYTFDGNVTRKDGKKVAIPVCRECTSQPRCSKWNGNYPYDDVAKQKEYQIIEFKRGWRKNQPTE